MFRKLTVAVCVVFLVVPAAAATASAATPWVPMQVGSGEYYSRLLFSDAEHGWAWGGTSIAHTVDGGASWTSGFAGGTIRGLDETGGTAWAVGEAPGANYSRVPLILRSTDGGSSWGDYDESALPGCWGGLVGVDFVDAAHGWVWGEFESGCWATADGGTTWDAVATPGSVRRMQFVDADHGFALRYGTPSRTGDGGKTWTAIPGPSASWYPQDMVFVDEVHGFAYESQHGLGVTSDGGDSWTWRPAAFNSLIKLAATDALHVWALNGDAVWGSDDAGAHWFLLRPSSGGLNDRTLAILGERGWLIGEDGAARTERSGLGDMRAPVTSVSGPLFIDETTAYGVAASDEGSGVYETWCRLDGGAWGLEGQVTVAVPDSPAGDSRHLIECFSTDVYGNEEEVGEQWVTVDVTAPEPVFHVQSQYQLGTWTNSPVSMLLSGNDGRLGSGTASIVVRRDGGKPVAHAADWTCRVEAPRTHANDGVHTITLRAIDALGHAGPEVSRAVRIDTRRPAAKVPAKMFVSRKRGAISFSAEDQKPCGTGYTVRIRVMTRKHEVVAELSPGKRFSYGRVHKIPATSKLYGVYVLAVTVTDAAGNKDVAYSRLYSNISFPTVP